MAAGFSAFDCSQLCRSTDPKLCTRFPSLVQGEASRSLEDPQAQSSPSGVLPGAEGSPTSPVGQAEDVSLRPEEARAGAGPRLRRGWLGCVDKQAQGPTGAGEGRQPYPQRDGGRGGSRPGSPQQCDCVLLRLGSPEARSQVLHGQWPPGARPV